MRKFFLLREVDDSGVSGTGRVAEGVQFSNGKCAMAWLTGPKNAGTSVCVYEDVASVERIHGHHGHTKIVFEEK